MRAGRQTPEPSGVEGLAVGSDGELRNQRPFGSEDAEQLSVRERRHREM
jgi:hypothetical protein